MFISSLLAELEGRIIQGLQQLSHFPSSSSSPGQFCSDSRYVGIVRRPVSRIQASQAAQRMPATLPTI
jgi:hypothetical protein